MFGSLIPWRSKSQSMSRRDDFFDPMLSLRREVDRIFDEFFNGFGNIGHDAGLSLRPAVDIAEDDKELVISAEIPGLDEKDLDVSLAGDLLTIKGEKKVEKEEEEGIARKEEEHDIAPSLDPCVCRSRWTTRTSRPNMKRAY